MLDKAEDYRFVDVSDINITGDIFPKHDGEADYNHPLKAEDIAFITEGVNERHLRVYDVSKVKIWPTLRSQIFDDLIEMTKEVERIWNGGLSGFGYTSFGDYVPTVDTRYGIHDYEGSLFKEIFPVGTGSFDFKLKDYAFADKIDVEILRRAYHDLGRLSWIAGDAIFGGTASYPSNAIASGVYKTGDGEGSFSNVEFGKGIVGYTNAYPSVFRGIGGGTSDYQYVNFTSFKIRLLSRYDGTPVIGFTRCAVGLVYDVTVDDRSYRRCIWTDCSFDPHTNVITVPASYCSADYMMREVAVGASSARYYVQVTLDRVYYWATPDFKATLDF